MSLFIFDAKHVMLFLFLKSLHSYLWIRPKSCFIVQASGEAAFQVLDTLKQLDYPEQHV